MLDTLESIGYYVHSSYQILVPNDSHDPAMEHAIAARFPEAVVLPARENYGKGLGLYESLCYTYRYALDTFEFKALLRLDTDALIIGHGPGLAALNLLRRDPSVGLAGRYVRGLASPDEFGNVWNNEAARDVYTSIAKLLTRRVLRQPLVNWRIRTRLFQALCNGYELADLVFGGAYIFS
ncbi:MAG: hypothetical protein ACRYFR_09260 [Janthinobacterium lividum]